MTNLFINSAMLGQGEGLVVIYGQLRPGVGVPLRNSSEPLRADVGGLERSVATAGRDG